MAAPAGVNPEAQVKALRTIAAIFVFSGLLIGIGIPVLFLKLGIQAYMTPWGFDASWIIGLFIMVSDFGLAWYFRRRAGALERTMLGLPPRGT
jgi:hypothetical protein